jgi:hypothetical protein
VLIVIFILPASNLWASPVCVALFSVLIAGGPLNCAKSDTDFGGQRYVKQAEFCGLSEG